MKRSRFLFNQIIDFENIRLAWLKEKRGKTFSYAITAINKDVNDNLEKIRQRLMSQNPDWGNYCIENLRLELKEPILVKTSRGVPFLGYSVGSCGVRLLRSKQRQKKKKIKNLEYLCSINYISEDIAAQRMNAVCNLIEVK